MNGESFESSDSFAPRRHQRGLHVDDFFFFFFLLSAQTNYNTLVKKYYLLRLILFIIQC